MSTGLKSLVDRVRRCGERTPSTASSTLLRRRRKILREGCCREAAARSYVVSVAHATGVGSAVTFDTGFTASILTANSSVLARGQDAHDRWHSGQIGFRGE